MQSCLQISWGTQVLSSGPTARKSKTNQQNNSKSAFSSQRSKSTDQNFQKSRNQLYHTCKPVGKNGKIGWLPANIQEILSTYQKKMNIMYKDLGVKKMPISWKLLLRQLAFTVLESTMWDISASPQYGYRGRYSITQTHRDDAGYTL